METVPMEDHLVAQVIKSSRPCSIAGCERVTRSPGSEWCGTHYFRWRRHGDPLQTLRTSGTRTVRPDGYIVIHGHQGHALADKRGDVFEHRMVLLAKIGPGTHPCHWCKRPVQWDLPRYHDAKLTTDHLDVNPGNNHPDNLVPSCHGCNTARQDKTNQRAAVSRTFANLSPEKQAAVRERARTLVLHRRDRQSPAA